MLEIFFSGLIVGFIIAIPIGPNGVLCFSRFLKNGIKSGWYSGLGISLADSIMGFLAYIGSIIIVSFITKYRIYFDFFAMFLFILMSVRFFFNKFKLNENIKKNSLRRDFLTSFLFTIATPVTILSFLYFFIFFHVETQRNILSYIFVFLGVFLGSFLWWMIFSFVLRYEVVKKKISSIIKYVDIIAGIVMLSFAIYLFVRILMFFNIIHF